MRSWYRLCRVAILASFIYIPDLSAEVLNIEITKGADNARPIAVVPFRYTSSQRLPQDVSQIVSDDLRRSGRFRPMPLADLPQKPFLSSQVELEDWKKKGIEAVVVGTIEAIDAETYRVSFELIDVFSDKKSSSSQLVNGELMVTQPNEDSVIASQQVRVNVKSLRRYSHKIADIIYQKLTGVRGAFATRLAYVTVDKTQARPYQLIVSDADGYNPKQLMMSAEPLMSPAWSPDGKKLAYVSFESKRSRIYIQQVFTGKRTMVSGFKGINGAPAWSPDGNKLALTLSKDGNPEIYILDLITNKFTRLTHKSSIDTEPNWTRDGQSVIFTSNRGGKPQIYKVKISGGEPTRVTYEGNYNASASFTPNGKYMVLVHRASDIFHIAIQDMDKGVLQSLTETRLDESPSIAPNGSMIIYATLSRGRKVLAVVSTDGRFRAILPANNGEIRAPAWSPFLD